MTIFSLINETPVTTNTLLLFIEVAVGVVISSVYIKSRIPKETIREQADLITALQASSELQKIELAGYKAQLAHLTGQLEAYKDLPLQALAAGIAEVANTNKQILTAIQSAPRTS